MKLADLYGVSVIQPRCVRLVPGPPIPTWIKVREWLRWQLPEVLLWWVLILAVMWGAE